MSLENVKKGDMLINENGNYRFVIETLGEIVFLSLVGEFKVAGSHYTKTELQNLGWIINQTEPAHIFEARCFDCYPHHCSIHVFMPWCKKHGCFGCDEINEPLKLDLGKVYDNFHHKTPCFINTRLLMLNDTCFAQLQEKGCYVLDIPKESQRLYTWSISSDQRPYRI